MPLPTGHPPEEEIKALFAAMSDVVLVVDREGRYLRIADTNAPPRLRPPRDLLGRRMHEVAPKEQADRMLAPVRRALDTRSTVTLEWPLELHGEVTWMSVAISPMTDNEAVVVCRDISELVAARQELERQRDALEQEVRERRQAQDELRALFAAMRDVVLVLDREGRYLRVASGTHESGKAHPEEVIGVSMRDLLPPETADLLVSNIQRALDTGETQRTELSMEMQGEPAWLSVAISRVSDDRVLAVGREITELVQARQELERQRDALEQEVRERRQAQDELRALFMAMDDLVIVFDAEGRCLRIAPTNPDLPYAPGPDMVGRKLHEVMPAGQADLILAHIKRAIAQHQTQSLEYSVEMDGRVVWLQAAISPMSTGSVVYVARDITERILAREELERMVAERTSELTTMLDVSTNVASTLELKPLLELIIDQIQPVVAYHRASIFLLEGDDLVLFHSRVNEDDETPVTLRFTTMDVRPFWDRLSSGGSYIIDDVRGDSDMARLYQQVTGPLFDTVLRRVHCFAAVPLALRDRVIGMITVSHHERAYYQEHHTRLLGAVANQAAIAIENARLYEQAQQIAAIEERQRLARELHDSVSQALYGIALGARTARALLDQDPSRAVEPVDYVLQLAEAGLAEMRALIFELRPESLAIEGLVAALEKQVAAISARYGLQVASELGDEPELSLTKKEVFYRVAQEALHNIVKHARARHVRVCLRAEDSRVLLEIADDGIGFDTSQGFPGHMGLVSMRERAAQAGANLDIESALGNGTRVCLTASLA